jgi:hypothetical protein
MSKHDVIGGPRDAQLIAEGECLRRLFREKTPEHVGDFPKVAPLGMVYIAHVDQDGKMHTWLVDAKKYGLTDERSKQ